MENKKSRNASEGSGSRAVPDPDSQPEENDSNRPNTNDQNPVERALDGNLPSTTKTGQPRRRMAWTLEMNKSVMRCYYKATKLETEMTLYRARLHELFISENPTFQVTEQRVADQRRTIMTRNLIAQPLIDEIRRQIREELEEEEQNASQEDTSLRQETETEAQDIHNNANTQAVPEHIREQRPPSDQGNDLAECRDKLNLLYTLYSGTDPAHRPFIPKQNSSAKLAAIVDKINKVLPTIINRTSNFSELHSLIYCAALAAAEFNGAKINIGEKHKKNDTKNIPGWKRRLEKRVSELRSDINRLVQYKHGKRSIKLQQQTERIIKNTKIHATHETHNTNLDECLDTLKQKLILLSKRLKRYNESNTRRKVSSIEN